MATGQISVEPSTSCWERETELQMVSLTGPPETSTCGMPRCLIDISPPNLRAGGRKHAGRHLRDRSIRHWHRHIPSDRAARSPGEIYPAPGQRQAASGRRGLWNRRWLHKRTWRLCRDWESLVNGRGALGGIDRVGVRLDGFIKALPYVFVRLQGRERPWKAMY